MSDATNEPDNTDAELAAWDAASDALLADIDGDATNERPGEVGLWHREDGEWSVLVRLCPAFRKTPPHGMELFANGWNKGLAVSARHVSDLPSGGWSRAFSASELTTLQADCERWSGLYAKGRDELAASKSQLDAHEAFIRLDNLGGDIPSQARAWCAVWKELTEIGVESFVPSECRGSGQRAVEFIRHVGKELATLQAELVAAKAENAKLKGVLFRCAVNATNTTGEESHDIPALDAALKVPRESVDDYVNDKFCDLKCEVTQKQEQLTTLKARLAEVDEKEKLAVQIYNEYRILKPYGNSRGAIDADSVLKAHDLMIEADNKRIAVEAAAEQRVKELEGVITDTRPKSECYDRIRASIGEENLGLGVLGHIDRLKSDKEAAETRLKELQAWLAEPISISHPLVDLIFRKGRPTLTQEQAESAARLVVGCFTKDS